MELSGTRKARAFIGFTVLSVMVCNTQSAWGCLLVQNGSSAHNTSIISSNCSGENPMILLGAISQTVPTYPGLPHTLKFNVKVSGTCCDPAAAAKVLVSLLPSSSEANVVHIHSNGGLWKAEELRFAALDCTVNLTFANMGSPLQQDSSCCSVMIGNVEVGLEDDYLIAEAAYKLWTRVLYLYAMLAFVGVLASGCMFGRFFL